MNNLNTARLGARDAFAEPQTLQVVEAGDRCHAAVRDVYGLLGLPVDAIDFNALLQALDLAALRRVPFLISTPNVNFLIKSHHNTAFRDSMMLSDLCLVDGMPLIWIAKFLQVPIPERLAGSDLFDRLKARTEKRLRVFLFGGTGDVAERVGAKLNAEKCGLECVGALNPGFGSVEELSSPEIINRINASGADLLAVFLNAEKAQAWLLNNHDHLTVPIRAQFGATINFEAGTIQRAPPILRSTGFEWLWRIKEEPYLWRRYYSDGKALLQLLFKSALPLAITTWLTRGRSKFTIRPAQHDRVVTLALSGCVVGDNVDLLVPFIRAALEDSKPIHLDLADVEYVDARFFGFLMGLKTQLGRKDLSLSISGVSPRMRRLFQLNRFEFLLSDR